ncbi:hypothetical protein GE061_002571 [Apolygus lucorum]|uniref:Molybdenum cofactor sulfurase n=1 Tax=Apolygus lucorum TaxID=248454 RepID=A0A6A4IXQ7_APOLU|nr:hypothetical protein GE061_002571 [Apolygus lucorum]
MDETEPTCDDVFSRETSERIRQEFKRLGDLCYLDQTSCALYSGSYIEKSLADLASNVYCNPHSNSTTSKHCTDSIDQVRYRVLQHFNTDVDEYSVIFTSGATESIKLLASSFKWKNAEGDDDLSTSTSEFVYMEDNHTSVLGMRDVVSARGAQVRCLSHQETLSIFRQPGERHPEKNWPTNSLFAYSAQCNFSGVKYPLSWVEQVHKGRLNDKTNWYCLLDAASYVSTSKLDLSVVQPDFVCISFYKIFGFPTGLGALLVKNKSAGALEKIYYGGGTVLMALSAVPEHVPRPALHDRFEDGTLNYLSIITLIHGFNTMEDMIGDFTLLRRHCFSLARYAFYALLKLHHSNGSPAVKLYADTPYDHDSCQGNIVNFNMLRANGEYVGYAEVLNMANMHGIQLRTGCFCNPGACRRHLNLTTEDVRSHYAAGHVCGDDHDLVDGRPTGSVRISFGAHNTKNDVDRLLRMLETCFVLQPSLHRIPASWTHQSNVLRHKFHTNISNYTSENGNLNSDQTPDYLDRHEIESKNLSRDSLVQPAQVNLRIIDQRDSVNVVRSDRSPYISKIFLYPIKSCGRFSVEKWDIDTKGLKYDRQWMVTTESGVALTQKSEPLLCLIRPYIDETNNQLRITFKGKDSICITLNPLNDGKIKDGYSLCQSKVCGDRIRGYDCGNDVATWLSDVLNRPGLRLIRQLPDDKRTNKQNSGALTLSNQSQFLFINDASVKWLADKLEEDSECSKESMINRFRSNLVMSGLEEEFLERSWTKLTIGKIAFNVDGPCSRCQMICIDQDTGLKTKEPLTTLTAAFQGKMKFGIYLSRSDTNTVSISVQDQVIPSVD